MDAVKLRELVGSFDRQNAVHETAKECVAYLRHLQGRKERVTSAHSHLCTAMVRAWSGEGCGAGELLHALGPTQAILVVYSNISKAS